MLSLRTITKSVVHFFKKQYTLFFNIAKRYGEVFSLALIDIDDFKIINDTYGHAGGDLVLKKFSLEARNTFRKSDIIIRYGGDEFAVIMPETDNDQAVAAVERLKNNLQESEFRVSAGIATYDGALTDESQMFQLADKRLYEEKKKKNCS